MIINPYRFGPGGDITSNLELWWKFDEGTGTSTTADSSGNGRTGTLVASPSWVTGQIGPYALDFNGSSQSVDYNSNLVHTGIATVACWFKKDANNTYRRFLQFNTNGGSCWMFVANGASNGTQQLDILFGNGVGFSAASSDGVWHHAALVLNNATGTLIAAYHDGVLMTTADSGFAGEGYVGIRVGRRSSTFYKGDVDDVRVYSRALSALDIATLYAYR
jgi:hypothetical protein